MRLTIDTGDSIDQVLAAVGALYKVELVVGSGSSTPAAVSTPSAPEPAAAAPKPRRRSGGSTRSAARSSRAPATTAPVDSAVIRAWARENSVTVSPRGRIPASVQQAYEAAQA